MEVPCYGSRMRLQETVESLRDRVGEVQRSLQELTKQKLRAGP